MKVKKILNLKLITSILLIAGLASCSKKSSSSNASRATGWNLDRQKNVAAKNKNCTKTLI